MTGSASPAPFAGFRKALDRLARGAAVSGSRLHRAEAPVSPAVDPLRLWDAASSDTFAVYWDDGAETTAGIGITPCADGAATAAADGAGTDASGLRRFGAVPFAAGWDDEDWAPLTEPGFVLPRWSVHRTSAGASLRLSVRGPLDPDERARIESELDGIEASLAAADRPPNDSGAERVQPTSGSLADADREIARRDWDEMVASALSEIDRGELQKVVLSRWVDVRLPASASAPSILRRLSTERTGRFRFGLRRNGRAFVGASPECLFAKRGERVDVEALAGTFDLGPIPEAGDLVRAAEYLFGSGKDLEEHALVVRGILEALEPLAVSVRADDWPRIQRARRLAHLSTDVRARVRAGVTPFDLMAALHPTPAVGGTPREAALDLIRRVEPVPRGLFAAPIGWIDGNGDACLAVGIRSALLVDDRARVYAGAGIVAASDPGAEWDETAAKLRWFGELLAGDGGADARGDGGADARHAEPGAAR